jgi:hypothetical protein
MEVRAGPSQKQKRSPGYLKEKYLVGFMVLHVKMVSGEINTMMTYIVCIKV